MGSHWEGGGTGSPHTKGKTYKAECLPSIGKWREWRMVGSQQPEGRGWKQVAAAQAMHTMVSHMGKQLLLTGTGAGEEGEY